MSSGKYKAHYGFNKTVIKDGWIVRLRKDGRIKAYLEKYPKETKWAAATSTKRWRAILAQIAEEIPTEQIGSFPQNFIENG